MKRFFYLFFLVVLSACSPKTIEEQKAIKQQNVVKETTSEYEFYHPGKTSKGLLILFPGLSGDASSIQEGTDFLSIAKENQISVLFMNFNHHIVLLENDKQQLTQLLDQVIQKHQLTIQKLMIGGFSSGGIVSTLWCNHLIENNHSPQPNKVFVVDSPLELRELFQNVTEVDSSSHPISIQEAEYVINYFEETLNTKDSLIQKIVAHSPFDYSTLNWQNIKHLKNIELRLYTEPDSIWWKTNRGYGFEKTGAFQLMRFAKISQEKGWDKLQLITTENKGYRTNGERHPHSWSIVDEKELLQWMLKD